MIWLRRTIVVPLALLFVLLCVPMLAIFRINDTVGNPDFYNDQFQQAGVYNFIYTDVLPAALEEAGIGDETSGVDIAALKPHIIDMLRRVLPPEWLQVQVEQTIDGVLPYVLGDADNFNINVALKDRVETAGQALKDTLHEEDVFPVFYDQAVALIVNETASDVEDMPSPFALTGDDMESIVRTVLPAEWALKQVDSAIDEVVPYLTRDKEQFMIQVDISGRLDALEGVVADIFKRPETYDYLFEDMLAPAIKENTQEITELIPGVTLTDEEVLSAAKETFPLEWYQARAADIVAHIFAYLGGTRETLDITIPLADRKPVMAGVLAELADRKLESLVDSLPPCTAAELLEMLLNPSLENLPTCKPIDISYREFKELFGIDLTVVLTPLVDTWVPDQWVIDEATLRQALGGEGDEDLLSQVRELVQVGLTYTDDDLRATLEADYETMEKVRQHIAGGFAFTEVELREQVKNIGNGEAGEQLQTFDDLRSWLGTGRRWGVVAWLIPLAILVAIGALGGRKWRSRLLWAAAVLAIMALLAYILYGPLFSAMVQPEIDSALMQVVGQAEGFQALVVDKGITIAQNAVDSFIGGLKLQALVLLIASVVLIVLVSVWHIWVRKRSGLATDESNSTEAH